MQVVSASRSDIDSPLMFLYRASGRKLISETVALEYARLVLKSEYGDEEVQRQQPLTISADGEDWVITGSVPFPDDFRLDGPFQMRVAQFDGQIRSFAFLTDYGASSKPVRTP